MDMIQKNTGGNLHGYWANETWKAHYFNGLLTGFYKSKKLYFKGHYLNGKHIGCQKYFNSQYFYNKSHKKFGEEIIWK